MQYRGAWHQGKYHGAGVASWPDKSTYEGEFVRGLMHGNGHHVLPDSISSYRGYFRYNLPDGKGKSTYSDGSTYDGDWKEGLREGKGTFTHGVKVQSGSWVNDQY